ncbi:MAG: Asp-tRNA(Asn)/Glu-tRNA(Gln) amidotransferase subunit GatB [Holophagales bacterium]|nr:Asp-tRNA(Asn)/Glu-tRNA(Gln) amidotransferase subunit GatB [Holophagales bacterium]
MQERYEAVIGLEVHVQLLTRSKMFCSCANRYGAEPNSLTCPVCLGLPGALPALNAKAVDMAIAFGLAIGANIREKSRFYRKQYFYPDLPKGYQITQGPVAVVEEGALEIPGDPAVRGVEGNILAGVERAHLEEDSGKSTHESKRSLVDLNRAGVPLLEIVGKPDLRSPKEAYDYLKTLHRLVIALGICDGNMEEGSFRCDANVSVRPKGQDAFGTRVEIKNLNSFRFVRQALDYEVKRHTELIGAGSGPVQETRGWDAGKGETRIQREKAGGADYRYFPEPDLPPLEITRAEIEAIRASMPELPSQRKARFIVSYGLTDYEADMLTQDRPFADYYESSAKLCGNPKQACNWMLGEMSRAINERGGSIETLGVSAEGLAELISMVDSRTINLTTAKETVFPALLAGEGSPGDIVKKRGLAQISDTSAIEAIVEEVLAAHPAQASELRAGNAKLRGFLVGRIMKAGKGKVNPQMVNEILDAKL